MNVLKEYKGIILSGVAVLLCFVGAFFVVGNAEQKNDRMNYAEHIFQEGTVSEIDIQIDEADWQDMMENPMAEEFHRANVTINGELMGNVAIRTKGNTSLSSVANSDSDRYSFKIDFDYYDDNGNYHGLRKLCLNNNFADDSYMREYICYKIMEDMGLPVPACGYTHITVNGEEWGLYLAVEPVDEVFLQTRFADATG
ncbi:MAG: CotH kinase family protein, partial [Anaerotignum sp.]|nr:CotH kinase family protein [Anaerotignum sp.]